MKWLLWARELRAYERECYVIVCGAAAELGEYLRMRINGGSSGLLESEH